MKREDIEKLLGGYATGTLSEVERKALFEAALEDQELFDAVADEAALKELLDDPQARESLLRALPAREKSLLRRFPAWSWAAAGAVAATVVIAIVEVRAPEPHLQLAARSVAPLNTPSEPKSAAPLPENAGHVVAPKKLAKQKAAVTDAIATKSVPVEIAAAQPKLQQPSALSAPSPAPPQSAISENDAVSSAFGGAKPGARALFYATSEMAFQAQTGAKDAAVAVKTVGAISARPAGIRYTVVRQEPNGALAEVEPDAVFRAGDRVRLSIETNSPGTLVVRDGDTELANVRAAPRTKYTVPANGAIELNGPPGTRKLKVVFSPAQERAPAPATVAPLVERSSEGATYIAEPKPTRLSFDITLVYQ